jgi:hypothetical protein
MMKHDLARSRDGVLTLSIGCGDDASNADGAAGPGGSSSQGAASNEGGGANAGGATGEAGATNEGGAGGGGPAMGSAGCGTAQEAGFPCFTTNFEGVDREYCVDIREGYDPAAPQAIVLGLHGCGGSPNGAHGATATQVEAGAGRYLFVYPKAAASCWDYTARATSPYAARSRRSSPPCVELGVADA